MLLAFIARQLRESLNLCRNCSGLLCVIPHLIHWISVEVLRLEVRIAAVLQLPSFAADLLLQAAVHLFSCSYLVLQRESAG